MEPVCEFSLRREKRELMEPPFGIFFRSIEPVFYGRAKGEVSGGGRNIRHLKFNVHGSVNNKLTLFGHLSLIST